MHIDQQRAHNLLADNPGNYYYHASNFEREQFKKWVTGLLQEREVTVDFAKADGELRSMTCTLQESRLPPAINKTTQKKTNDDVCVVWDCKQDAWRSFRWDRVKRIQFDIG